MVWVVKFFFIYLKKRYIIRAVYSEGSKVETRFHSLIVVRTETDKVIFVSRLLKSNLHINKMSRNGRELLVPNLYVNSMVGST